jgi:hypothetical protein
MRRQFTLILKVSKKEPINLAKPLSEPALGPVGTSWTCRTVHCLQTAQVPGRGKRNVRDGGFILANQLIKYVARLYVYFREGSRGVIIAIEKIVRPIPSHHLTDPAFRTNMWADRCQIKSCSSLDLVLASVGERTTDIVQASSQWVWIHIHFKNTKVCRASLCFHRGRFQHGGCSNQPLHACLMMIWIGSTAIVASARVSSTVNRSNFMRPYHPSCMRYKSNKSATLQEFGTLHMQGRRWQMWPRASVIYMSIDNCDNPIGAVYRGPKTCSTNHSQV